MEGSKAELGVYFSISLSVPENSLVSRSQGDKKKSCVETTSSSWMCSAISAPRSECAGSPAASAAGHDRSGATAAATSVQQLVRQDWTAVDCAGEVVASIPAA